MLKRTNLDEEVYTILVDLILNGDFTAAQKISLEEIEKNIGVSRTPVLSALKRMVNEGMLETSRGSGFYIPKFELEDIEKLATAITMLGHCVCAEAIKKVTADDIKRLRKLVEETLDAATNGTAMEYYKKDYEFHMAIAGIADNCYLCDTYSRFVRLSDLMWNVNRRLRPKDVWMMKPEQHAKICDALETKNDQELHEMIGAHHQLIYRLAAEN